MGSNPAEEDNRFLITMNVCSMTSFRGEIKPLVPCHKILQHVKERYMHERLVNKFHGHNAPSFSALLPDVSAGYCQGCLVDESGVIRTQIRMHNRSETVAVLGTPCTIPPRNSNSGSYVCKPYIRTPCLCTSALVKQRVDM
jgi:hypothetical protein